MSEGFLSFLRVVKAIVLYIGLGALVAFIFYNLKKRDLFGGYIGGLVVGVIGALIGGLVLDSLFYDKIVTILDFLSRGAGVNLIAGFIGAYAALYVMNRLNHNRERRKY
ncbi:MAG TPA: hypothetical protein PKG60_12650 [Spirochaetota bacterium]|nr:hypothetical protein [Spirochaetota bacterium]HPS87594.1 hypothetical protein [Spirochaetota bacterium]